MPKEEKKRKKYRTIFQLLDMSRACAKHELDDVNVRRKSLSAWKLAFFQLARFALEILAIYCCCCCCCCILHCYRASLAL